MKSTFFRVTSYFALFSILSACSTGRVEKRSAQAAVRFPAADDFRQHTYVHPAISGSLVIPSAMKLSDLSMQLMLTCKPEPEHAVANEESDCGKYTVKVTLEEKAKGELVFHIPEFKYKGMKLMDSELGDAFSGPILGAYFSWTLHTTYKGQRLLSDVHAWWWEKRPLQEKDHLQRYVEKLTIFKSVAATFDFKKSPKPVSKSNKDWRGVLFGYHLPDDNKAMSWNYARDDMRFPLKIGGHVLAQGSFKSSEPRQYLIACPMFSKQIAIDKDYPDVQVAGRGADFCYYSSGGTVMGPVNSEDLETFLK